MRTRAVGMALIAGVVRVTTGVVAASTGGRAPAGPGQTSKPATVLFLCPHGAAKSVLASAYFQRRARERGLNVRVESAGTGPDAEVARVVANHLTRHGYPVPVAKPRQVTSKDLALADVVVSIGCDLRGFPAPRGTLVRWDDVPAPSEDFAGADDAIQKRVVELVEELIRHRGK